MLTRTRVARREFVRSCSAVASGVVLAGPLFGAETAPPTETNIADFLAVPRGRTPSPARFPAALCGSPTRARW
jgi:hypothetical protein